MKLKILLAIVGILTALLALEISARVSAPKMTLPTDCFKDDSILNHVHVPNKTCPFITPYWNIAYKINSQGLRDMEYPITKPQDKFRILVVGDSFTEGWGIEVNKSFPKQLENKLNSKSKKFEVINAGVASYSPILEYLYLKNEGLKYNPDIVIMAFDMTDFIDEKEYLKSTKFEENGEPSAVVPRVSPHLGYYLKTLEENRNKPVLKGLLGKIEVKIKKKSSLAARVLPVVPITAEPSVFNVDAQSWNLATKNILLTRDLVEKQNIEFLLLLYPWQGQLGSTEALAPLAKLSQFSKDNQIQTLDLTNDFDPKKAQRYYIKGDLHLSKEGSEFVAEKLYEYISKNYKH